MSIRTGLCVLLPSERGFFSFYHNTSRLRPPVCTLPLTERDPSPHTLPRHPDTRRPTPSTVDGRVRVTFPSGSQETRPLGARSSFSVGSGERLLSCVGTDPRRKEGVRAHRLGTDVGEVRTQERRRSLGTRRPYRTLHLVLGVKSGELGHPVSDGPR